MILLAGDPSDCVMVRVRAALDRTGAHFRTMDLRNPEAYRLERGSSRWRLFGGDCRGDAPVRAVFLRHTRARSPSAARALHRLRVELDTLVATATCRVVNRPAGGFANCSKPLQLMQLAQFGFNTPRTLVTNRVDLAAAFIDGLALPAICKGISNVKTIPRFVDRELRARLHLIRKCPVQFQEYIEGDDMRVTVVADRAFVTRVGAQGPMLGPSQDALLPPDVLAKCIAFARKHGLVLGGYDFRRTASGTLYALELNPFPEYTYFEDAGEQPLTRMVVEYLIKGRARPSVRA